MAKCAPQGGRVVGNAEVEGGAVSLNKFEVLAVGPRWTYHEKAPSCRAKTRTIDTRLILTQVGVKH